MRKLRCSAATSAIIAGIVAGSSGASATQVPGVGWEGQGADAVLVQLDGNTAPELILMAYDNPARDNSFRYKVGFNVNSVGETPNWGPMIQVPGLGWEGQGAGAATADLDGNGRPELIFMAYDNPARDNNFRYTIGWNLNAAGQATRWTNHAQVAGVGWEGQGAAVVIGQIDANPRPDMIFIAYDNPARDNNFRYRIGYNVDTQGNASWDPNFIMVPGVGWEGQGLGAALVNADGNPRPDLALLAYDNPARDNNFRVKVGFNLGANGVAQTWQPGFDTFPGVGWEGQGAGLAVGCLDGDPRADWLVMAYDNPARDNSFRYYVLANRSNPPCAPGAGTTNVPLRKSITALTAPEVESLRRGFAQMRAWNSAPRNSPEYRKSLLYWANMHSYFGSGCANPNDPIRGINNPGMQGVQTWSKTNTEENATWCTCEHGDAQKQFLTWHRMYLYYFERVLQSAANDPNLRLPYWDYNSNGQLPPVYRDLNWTSGGQTVANPLYVANRQAQLNAGTGSITASLADPTGAMNQTSYVPFNDTLESGVHGNIHCATGVNNCPTGLMGSVPVAGLDPIFYSHHANIDRLYECWLRVSEAARLPANQAQLDRQYSFIDSNGQLVTRRVGDMLTTAQLAYNYAAGGGCPVSPFAAQLDLSALGAIQMRSFAVQGPATLRRGVTVVPLRIGPEAIEAMRAIARPERPARASVVIEDIQIDAFPGVMYEVYLRDRTGRRTLVGVINFFNQTAPHTDHEGAAVRNVRLDATKALQNGEAAQQSLEVEFVPTTGVTGPSAESLTPRINPRANVRFGRIRLEVEP